MMNWGMHAYFSIVHASLLTWIGYLELDHMNIPLPHSAPIGCANWRRPITELRCPIHTSLYYISPSVPTMPPPRRRRSDRRCAVLACMHARTCRPACCLRAGAARLVVADTTAAKLASQDRRGLVRREGRRSTATRARRTQNIQWWTHPMANWPIRVGKCAAA
jgi:hypothetical protein